MSVDGVLAPSLTQRVLKGVLLPLALTWLIGTVIAIGIANYLTEQAFDHAMLDDAHSVSANVQVSDTGIELLLSPREVTTVLFDQVESVYFAVLRPDGSVLAGNPALRAPAPEGGAQARFSDIVFQDQSLRAVVLQNEAPNAFKVVIAQTTHARATLIDRLLAYALTPQLLLLALLAAWVWYRVGKDLRPLGELQLALDRRDARDLTPVPVVHTSREVERLGDAVNALFERLDHSVSAQREFAGNVAHELRTPLAGIRALAEYGLAQQTPAVWREQLERIAASQSRASRLIDQLLGLALADEANTGLKREAVRLDQLVEHTVMRHLARADARGVDLGARGLDEPVTVQANVALVEGILDNLIDNALRYGGRTLTIELAGKTLSVVDDGPGIAPEAQRDLVQRWSQGAAGQQLGQGSGLGLSIVSRYAKLLGAALTVENDAVSGGLRVSLRFGG
ncbi:sensor histidine kinase [Variovorax sp. PAMC 28711]|uniref:sensor histidine kinase n=1 Tax=Variovorax sp. PAMC 28711 TaxID=1795631 RepID=UPI00078B43FE|nr:sensor histidine kinase [Variovorax sp. PAMC 28711]AMM24700.1 histidine kinase [Variovorax sp. PAMC 28711]